MLCLFGADPAHTGAAPWGNSPARKGHTMATHLLNTSEVAAELGISPASMHAYMNARSGKDQRFWSVPQAHYFVGARNVPAWTTEDVQDWKVWYRIFQTQLLPTGFQQLSRRTKTDG